MDVPLNSKDLSRSIQQVFSSMLGLDLVSAEGDTPPDFPPERKVSSAVGISGEWNGAVLMECGSATACLLASVMMGSGPPASVDEVVRDVIGELTNMVAGTFKKNLPGHSTLTLPCIIEGSDYSMDIIQGQRLLKTMMLWDGRGIILSVVKGRA